MGIPVLHSFAFFILIFALGVGIYPSDRELGLRYSMAKSSEQAFHHLSRHFHKEPEDYANTLRYVRSLAENGSGNKAVSMVNEILQSYNTDPNLYRILAGLHEDFLHEAEAASAYESLFRFELEPEERYEVALKLRAYYQKEKEYGRLKLLYREMFSFTGNTDWLYELARISSSTKDWDLAVWAHQQLLKINPEDAEALSWFSAYYEIFDDQVLALKYYHRLAHLSTVDDYWRIRYAQFLFRNGHLDTLIQYLKESESDFQNQKERLIFLAQAYESGNRPVLALRQWKKIYSMYPSDMSVGESYVYALFETGQYEEIIRILEEWHEENRFNHRSHHLLGDAYDAVGRKQDARREFEAALQLIRLQH